MVDDAREQINKSEDDSSDDLEDEELTPHCMGHHFHWSEVLFILLAILGIILAAAGAPAVVSGLFIVISTATAVALMWNLVTIKRLAAATELIRKDVQVFKAENNRARGLQAEKKRQDAEMKDRLNKMEKAELLLKGSARGLEDVVNAEKEMKGERDALNAQRKELAAELEKDLKELHETCIKSAKLELEKRAELFFDEVDINGDGMAIDSPEWKKLVALMEENGITINQDVAGTDGVLEKDEFDDYIDETLDSHFEKLRAALTTNEGIQAQIAELQAELGITDPRSSLC